MEKANKKSGLPFLLIGILSCIALNALIIFLDLRELFSAAILCIYLAVPLLFPIILGKAANRKISDSIMFMNMGILAVFIVSRFITSESAFELYERHFPNLDNEFIAQEMHDVRLAAFYQLIEAILLLLTSFTVKIIMNIRQINK